MTVKMLMDSQHNCFVDAVGWTGAQPHTKVMYIDALCCVCVPQAHFIIQRATCEQR